MTFCGTRGTLTGQQYEQCQDESTMIEYEQRDATLRLMGFATYGEYLRSRLWGKIRRRVLKCRTRCACCGEPAREVHHKDYRAETLTGADISGLLPLCRTCHDLAEFDAGGRKGTLCDANQKIELLQALDKNPNPSQSRPHSGKGRPLGFGRCLKGKTKKQMILASIPRELLPITKKAVDKPAPARHNNRISPFTLTKAINIVAPIAISQRGPSSVLPLIGSKNTRDRNSLPFPNHALMTPVSWDNKTRGDES